MTENQPYIVSARKYRPSTFASVVGQQALTATLKNAIATGRLAQAYLFCGPRGVGKTSCARIFARTINCENRTPEGEACGQCESCKAIARGNSYNIMELDAASNNGVDKIRELTEQVNVPPPTGKYRVFIIDEVHMLSASAFNAFLKTLEEPPAHAIFILATTEKHKVIPTILSRCQIYDFKRITIADIADHLQHVAQQEGIEADPAALNVVARKADGAMRDALSIFDQVAASAQGHITYDAALTNLNVLDYDYFFRLVDTFRRGEVAEALLIYKEIRDKGFDSLFFLNGLAAHIRDLLVASDKRTVGLLEVSADVADHYLRQAAVLPASWYCDALQILNTADMEYRTASSKQLLVEVALIRLCRIGQPTPGSTPQPAPVATKSTGEAPAPSASAPAGAPTAPPQDAAPARTAAEPAPQRTASTPRPAARTSTGMRRPTTISLSRDKSAASVAAEPTTDYPENTAPASPEATDAGTPSDMASLWSAFMQSHADRHILVHAMRSHLPERQPDGSLLLELDHDAQAQAVEQAQTELVEHLRAGLHEPGLTLSFKVRPQARKAPELTDQEYLRQVVASNATIGQLLSATNAELI